MSKNNNNSKSPAKATPAPAKAAAPANAAPVPAAKKPAVPTQQTEVVRFDDLDQFTFATEELFKADAETKYSMKYKHTKGVFVLKTTNNKKVREASTADEITNNYY